MILELDTLHILPADIQHAVNRRIEERGRRRMRNGFNLAVVQRESRLQQRFAVPC